MPGESNIQEEVLGIADEHSASRSIGPSFLRLIFLLSLTSRRPLPWHESICVLFPQGTFCSILEGKYLSIIWFERLKMLRVDLPRQATLY